MIGRFLDRFRSKPDYGQDVSHIFLSACGDEGQNATYFGRFNEPGDITYFLYEIEPESAEYQLILWTLEECCHWAIDDEVNLALDDGHSHDWLPMFKDIVNYVHDTEIVFSVTVKSMEDLDDVIDFADSIDDDVTLVLEK